MSGSATLQMHVVENISVVRWTGAVLDDERAAQLRTLVVRLVDEAPFVVVDLRDVDAIDSAGLGLLVRLRMALQKAGGDLKLCAVPAAVSRVLRITRLGGTFDVYNDEAAACAAFAAPRLRATGTPDLGCDVLCCDASTDLLIYLRELLKAAGFRVAISSNAADAVKLARARRPRVVVISRELRSAIPADATGRDAAIVELPPGFARGDPSDAARALLERVTSALAGA